MSKLTQTKKWRREYMRNYRLTPGRIKRRKERIARKRAKLIKNERELSVQEVKKFVLSLKENEPCADCGQIYPPIVMDFDHVHGPKSANISQMPGLGWSQMRIIEEVVKCDLVCANCHRLRHAQRHRQHQRG